MKRYRVQRSDHQGVVNRAFGGRVVSWSRWRTVATFAALDEAEAEFARWAGRGLTRWRLIHGTEVKRASM